MAKRKPAIELVEETTVKIKGLNKKRKSEVIEEARIIRERAYAIVTKLGWESHDCYHGPGDEYHCETDKIKILYTESYDPDIYAPPERDTYTPQGMYIHAVGNKREVFIEDYDRVWEDANNIKVIVEAFEPGRWQKELDKLWKIAKNGAKTVRERGLLKEINKHYEDRPRYVGFLGL